ncbi:MAG TPA: hypothetical protein VGC60_08560 [Pyrinomonadaceae bacterium]|jgi:hypothetical protein
MNPFSEDESISVRQVVVVLGVSHSHRGFSPVVSTGFGYEETASTVFFRSL